MLITRNFGYSALLASVDMTEPTVSTAINVLLTAILLDSAASNSGLYQPLSIKKGSYNLFSIILYIFSMCYIASVIYRHRYKIAVHHFTVICQH